jgi:molybdenum cofactor cytidylyltransferase
LGLGEKMNELDDVDGVVLAAGFSSRAGTFKMALEIDGKPLIRHTVDTMRNFSSQQIVVAGYEIQRIVTLLNGYPGLRVVYNQYYESGMFSSVKEGVKYVTADWFFFTPGDIPMVSPQTYEALLKARSGSPDAEVFIPVCNSRKGHPILVKGTLKKEILSEPQDSNLKVLINRNSFVPVVVEDHAIHLDVDTIEDYHKVVNLNKE